MINSLKELLDNAFIEWKDGSDFTKKDYDIYIRALLNHIESKVRDECMNYWKYLKEFKK